MASSASERAADLCILGGGIAGMLLAERALARGRRVLLIERGMPLTARTSSAALRKIAKSNGTSTVLPVTASCPWSKTS